VAVAALSMAIMAVVRFPEIASAHKRGDTGRPMGVIMRQPVFIVAAAGAALGYGVMNLLMAATPLAMRVCGMSFDNTALVLEWHVIAMLPTLIDQFTPAGGVDGDGMPDLGAITGLLSKFIKT